MIAKLARHAFPDRPDWKIIKDEVPLGTEYEIIGFRGGAEIYNPDLNEKRGVDCYLVKRVDNGKTGYLPIDAFDLD